MADNEMILGIEEAIESAQKKIGAKKEIKFDIQISKKKIEEGVEQLKQTFSGLDKKVATVADGIKKAMDGVGSHIKSTFSGIGNEINNAFTVTNMQEHAAAAARFGDGLADSLLSLDKNMGALEDSVVDIIAPLAGVVVPIFNDALSEITGLAGGVAQVTSALFGGAAGAEALKQGATGVVDVLPNSINDTLSPQIQAVVDKALTLTEPIKQIDLTPVITSFSGLQTALVPFTQELFSGLEWAYFQVFVPLATWTAEGLLPGFLDLVSGAMRVLTETATTLQPLATWLWDSFLQPIATWTGGVIVDTLQWLVEGLENVSIWISENQALVEGIAIVIASVATAFALVNAAMTIWNVISGVGTAVTGAFGAAMAFLTSPIGLVVVAIGALIAIVVLLVKNWDSVKAAALSVWEAIKGAFSSAWEWFKSKVLDPITGGFKGMINGVIGFLNSLIGGIVKGINGIIGLLNKIRIDVPDAVPIIGGLSFGFHIPTMTAPQIPLLARGAVLPANKPFLAVVGDQRHGTNVEAPLATIQQAVSLVMQQQSQRMEQSLLQSVQVQKQILEAVLGIEIGDHMIAAAAERYRRKMAVVKGGYV